MSQQHQQLISKLEKQLKKLNIEQDNQFVKEKLQNYQGRLSKFLEETEKIFYNVEKCRFNDKAHSVFIDSLIDIFEYSIKQFKLILGQEYDRKQMIIQQKEEGLKQIQMYEQIMQKKEQKVKENDEFISNLKQQLEQRELQLQQLQAQIEEKEQPKRRNIEDLSLKGKNFCDIQISLDSLKDLSTQPLEIKYNVESQKEYEEIKSNFKNSIIVGLQGMQGKGKTYINNVLGLCEENNQLRYQPTQGLQTKLIRKSNDSIFLIDSAGLDRSYSFEWDEIDLSVDQIENDDILKDNKKYSAMINQFNEKHIAQKILQHFLLQNSNILIVVVGILTIEEQKLINQIVNRFKVDSNLLVYVIHNFKEFSYIDEVKNEIQNIQSQFRLDILDKQLSNFEGENKYSSIFLDQQDDSIQHLIYAQENTEAGNYFNPFAKEYIRRKITITTADKQNLDLSQKFEEFFKQNLKNYINLRLKKSCQEKLKNPEYFKVETAINESEKIFKEQIFINNNYEIQNFCDLSVDVFGRIKSQFNYSITNLTIDEEDYKIVEIELPGEVYESCKPVVSRDINKQIQELKIEIQKSKQPDINSNDMIANTRIFGKIRFAITVCMELKTKHQIIEHQISGQGIYSIKIKCEDSVQIMELDQNCKYY